MNQTTTIIAGIIFLLTLLVVFYFIYKSGVSTPINKSGKEISKGFKSKS
jgi:hypothetical protein